MEFVGLGLEIWEMGGEGGISCIPDPKCIRQKGLCYGSETLHVPQYIRVFMKKANFGETKVKNRRGLNFCMGS